MMHVGRLIVFAGLLATVATCAASQDPPQKSASAVESQSTREPGSNEIDDTASGSGQTKPGQTKPGQTYTPGKSRRPAKSKRTLLRGKVVLWKDALKKRGVTAFEEFAKLVVLETNDGQLIPIVPDWRGRAFFQDKRLRNRRVELVCHHRPETSTLQVLMVFTFDKDGNRKYTDYWCDICSIPMYEIKPCDCCQADIRLRYQAKKLPDYITAKWMTSIRVGDPMEDVVKTLKLWGVDEYQFDRYTVSVPVADQSTTNAAGGDRRQKAVAAGFELPDGTVIDAVSQNRKLVAITKHIPGERGKADDREETGYTSLTYDGTFVLGRDPGDTRSGSKKNSR